VRAGGGVGSGSVSTCGCCLHAREMLASSYAREMLASLYVREMLASLLTVPKSSEALMLVSY
jgi:hypothetical protein